MFLKKYALNIIIIIIIFCLSLLSPFYLKNEYFNKKILKIQYKFINYHLGTQNFIFPYIDLVKRTFITEQYQIRNEVLVYEECKFLNNDIESFLIEEKKFGIYEINMASNTSKSDDDLNKCLDIFLLKLEKYIKNLFEVSMNSILESYLRDLDYYKNILSSEKSSLDGSKYILLLNINELNNKTKEMKRFLEYVNKSDNVEVFNEKLKNFKTSPVTIFVLTFVLLLIFYIIIQKIFLSKSLIYKIFN